METSIPERGRQTWRKKSEHPGEAAAFSTPVL